MKTYILIFYLLLSYISQAQTNCEKGLEFDYDTTSVPYIDLKVENLRDFPSQNPFLLFQNIILQSGYLYIEFEYGFENDSINIEINDSLKSMVLTTNHSSGLANTLKIAKSENLDSNLVFNFNKKTYIIPIKKQFALIGISYMNNCLLIRYHNFPSLHD